MKTLDPQQITPALEDGVVRDVPETTFVNGKTIADYDSPEYVASDDTLPRAEKIRILENWLPTKQGDVFINAYGQEMEENAPYTRRVKLLLQDLKDDIT